MSRKASRKALLLLRGLQAVAGVVLVGSTMLSYGTFTLADDDRYRFAQTYQFVSVVLGYTALQIGLLYGVFVGLLHKAPPDAILERSVDATLVISSTVCGYMANRKVGTYSKTLGVYHVDNAALSCSMAACFVTASLFVLSLGHSLCLALPSHPDAVENLVPRGNYGPRRCIPGSIPMLSPRDGDTTGIAQGDEDKTENLVPRGNFCNDLDKTDRLMPRGNFNV
ncbi:hypothetical protein ACHHYP_20790 [Achlya hypogyna]|uniref:MARVEL domain-containing protein n=1 Tax=Achlya hypogyna TaxID=1202772 RepID=A0A1V9Y9S1_ACHHY|nr:hypothetical protein ACHHYP_20790 [Achlya hypogyna]